MSSTNISKASRKPSEILVLVAGMPLALIRRLMHVPTALVDMMERHGMEK